MNIIKLESLMRRNLLQENIPLLSREGIKNLIIRAKLKRVGQPSRSRKLYKRLTGESYVEYLKKPRTTLQGRSIVDVQVRRKKLLSQLEGALYNDIKEIQTGLKWTPRSAPERQKLEQLLGKRLKQWNRVRQANIKIMRKKWQ